MNVLLKYCFSKTLMVLSRIAVVSEKKFFKLRTLPKKKTKFRIKKNNLLQLVLGTECRRFPPV